MPSADYSTRQFSSSFFHTTTRLTIGYRLKQATCQCSSPFTCRSQLCLELSARWLSHSTSAVISLFTQHVHSPLPASHPHRTWTSLSSPQRVRPYHRQSLHSMCWMTWYSPEDQRITPSTQLLQLFSAVFSSFILTLHRKEVYDGYFGDKSEFSCEGVETIESLHKY